MFFVLYRYGVTPENIILYGQSIGTVPTIDLAARYECAAVILHSPLMSGLRVAFPDTRKTYCFDAFPRWVQHTQHQTYVAQQRYEGKVLMGYSASHGYHLLVLVAKDIKY